MGKTRKYFFAAGLSGLLLGLAYSGLGWLVWISLVPLLWSLLLTNPAQDHTPKKQYFLIGFFAGFVYFLTVFRWLWSVYPLDTIGIEGRLVSLLGIGAIYLVSSAGMAVFWGFFGLVFGILCTIFRKKSAHFLFFVPAFFTLFEYARSWGFGFLWAGSGSLFGPHWTLGNLAYSLVNNRLVLKLASLAGIYGITFVVILVNCGLYLILAGKFTRIPLKQRMLVRIACAGLIVALITLAPALIKPRVTQNEGVNPPSLKATEGQRKINFAIIQTAQQTRIDPSPQERLASFKEQLELLDRVATEHPESQLIVFPEASDFFKNLSLFLTPAQVQDYFYKLFKEPRLIISGSRILDSTTGKAYSRVFSLDTHGDIIGFYDKRLVAPGGEFLPYPLKFLVSVFSKDASSLFNQLRDLRPGQKEISTVGFRYQFNVAPIICSEAMAPGLIKKTTQNSDVMVSMASYGAFHGNRTIADQMLAITRFRATENHKPIITAANMGRSYVVDAEGNVIFLAQEIGSQILTGSIAISPIESWYTRVGNAPVMLGCLLLVVMAVLKTRIGQIKNWLRRNQS